MATVKLASLAIRTAAKPVASWLKSQATQHESFRNFCINWAQRMHRMEARMRTGLINGQTGDIKPLNETRAIQNGANNLAEIFLFGVAATLILGETYRGSQKTARRRDNIDDQLDLLREDVDSLLKRWEGERGDWERRVGEEGERNAELQRIISAVIDAGLRNGWLSNQVDVNSDYALRIGEEDDESTDGSSSGSVNSNRNSATNNNTEHNAEGLGPGHPATGSQIGLLGGAGGTGGAVTRTLPILTLEDWTKAIHRKTSSAVGVVRSGIGVGEEAAGEKVVGNKSVAIESEALK